MISRNIESFGASNEQIQHYFSTKHSQYATSDLNLLFDIAMNNKSLFPSINMPINEGWQQYIDRWVAAYIRASSNPPSKRRASPKSSCSDPVIKEIVRVATQLSDTCAIKAETYHTLFMSAENCQGGLLEEYIAAVIAPLGWIWCQGNTLRSVDFCSSDGGYLLQVKNKSNTENSSSSAIRTGTTIEKWYRLGTRTVNGERVPDYRWEDLNSIIYTQSGQRTNLSEEGYLKFIRSIVTANSEIITDR